MKTLVVNRKCFMFIVVTLLITFGLQGAVYAQAGNPTITASTRQPLMEATLDGSIITLTLSGGIYGHWSKVRKAVTVSGIAGVTVPWHTVERVSDTKVQVILGFDGTNIDKDGTLTFTIQKEAIADYEGPALTAKIPVTATQEPSPTIVASVVSPLTETTLHGSVVTLTLSNGVYRNLDAFIASALTVSGIAGVAIDNSLSGVDRVSDTEVEVELEFNGNIDTDTALTFTLGADAIVNYEGAPLTAEIPVSAVVESLTASTILPLTEGTLNTSVVTLTLSGGISYDSSVDIKNALTLSGIAGVTIFDFSIDTRDPISASDDISEITALDFVGVKPVTNIGVNRVSNTEAKVRLRFDGTNINTDTMLTFTLGAAAILNYEGPSLIAEILVSADTESIEASTVFPLAKETLDGNVVTLTLSGASYKFFVFDTENVTVSGIAGVTIRRTFGVRYISDTEIAVELEFNGDFKVDSRLTFTVEKGLIANYTGPPLTAEISVSSVMETQVFVAESERPPMYWVNTKTGTLHSLTGTRVVPVRSGLRITSLVVDTAGRKLYWTERTGDSSGTIKRVNLDGTTAELLATLSTIPIGIAIDSARNKLYWTNSDRAIQSANLNGENVSTVIQLEDEIAEKTSTSCAPKALGVSVLWGLLDAEVGGGCDTETTRINLTSPADIAVDAVGGKLYWTELSGRIRRVNLDGTNLDTIAIDLGIPGGIAVADGKVYWTEGSGRNRGSIRRADLNGTNIETLTILQGAPAGISVDVVDGKVYWANSFGGIQRVDINGGEVENVALVTAPGDFALGSGTRAKPGTPERPVVSSTLSISPSLAQSPAVGEQLTLNLSIKDGESVAGYQATVQFDTTALRFVSGANGDFLPAGAFFVEPKVEGNLVQLNAASLAGESNGAGTLATLTFEVVAVKISTLTLSDVLLSNSTGKTFIPQIENAQITEPTGLKEDVNADGSVNIVDLVLVASNLGKTGQNTADVNDDGQVNIVDLVLVAGALGASAGAPSLYPQSLEMLTAADIQLWLTQAQHLNLTDATSQMGILFLEQLLTVLIPKETALLHNYPNPFNPETWVPYQLAKPAEVTITIYAVDGQMIRRLPLGLQSAGMYQTRSRAAYWDGRNAFGESVASGIYFYTLSTKSTRDSVTAGDFTATRKMLIRK